MPRKPKPNFEESTQPTVARLWFLQTGERLRPPQLANWDPKPEQLTQAILEVLASGCTVCLRPGSGGSVVGVAIWEPDYKHPYEWCTDDAALDVWAAGVLEDARRRRDQAAD